MSLNFFDKIYAIDDNRKIHLYSITNKDWNIIDYIF